MIPSKNKDFPNRVIVGKAVLVNPKKGENIVLNDSGTFIWKLINGKRTVKEIVKKFLAEYEVEEKKAKTDVFEYLESLRKEKYILF